MGMPSGFEVLIIASGSAGWSIAGHATSMHLSRDVESVLEGPEPTGREVDPGVSTSCRRG